MQKIIDKGVIDGEEYVITQDEKGYCGEIVSSGWREYSDTMRESKADLEDRVHFFMTRADS